MNSSVQSFLVGTAVYALGIVCPAVPGFLWEALLNAILSGDITPDHIQQFMKDHGIQTYDQFPNDPTPPASVSNVDR